VARGQHAGCATVLVSVVASLLVGYLFVISFF
jgi:hypothetical protein